MRIVLIAIVKNEENIIKRCIESGKNILDGICITDTGSTDNTIQVIENYAKDINVKYKVYKNKWKNFGDNRSLSFRNAQDFIKKQKWDIRQCYGLLLDADMILKVGNFDKRYLKNDEYKIVQESSVLNYFNTRLIKMNLSWNCIGVTHEYWECDVDISSEKLQKDILYIDDIGDGGCKNDKFKRDVELLENGVRKEPDNKRYYFYLAQTYKDIGNYQKAIDLYFKRIKMGECEEEIWYCYYMISKCWKYLNKTKLFIKYALKAYNYRPTRAESIYSLTKYFRKIKDYENSYKYYKIGEVIKYPNDILFIEKNVYMYLFEYEYTILQYYLNPDNRLQGLIYCINFINNFDTKESENVFSNLQFYIPRLLDYGNCIDLNFESPGYNDLFIYQWYPLEIGKINEENKLQIIKQNNIPRIFRYLTGSSNIFEYNDELWCITHFVSLPRKYFHKVIVLDKNFNIKRYSIPFYFDLGIEYCLGLIIIDNVLYATTSRNDSEPIICNIHIDKIFWFYI